VRTYAMTGNIGEQQGTAKKMVGSRPVKSASWGHFMPLYVQLSVSNVAVTRGGTDIMYIPADAAIFGERKRTTFSA
jgi:hypothetical protein